MEENANERSVNNPANKVIIPITFILIVLIGLAVFNINKPNGEVMKSENLPESQMQTTPKMSSATYKDGFYKVIGGYKSPGGDETIEVKLTLKDNIVTEAEVVPNATLEKSIYFQGLFVGGFKEFVIGKNINEVKLDKVSGSSLTPKGFNDAIDKIKSEAKV